MVLQHVQLVRSATRAMAQKSFENGEIKMRSQSSDDAFVFVFLRQVCCIVYF